VSVRIKVTFDQHSVTVLARKVNAVGETMHQPGYGYIYAGARRKMPIDVKRKPVSAFMICRWIAKTRGVNVLAPSPSQQLPIERFVATGVNRAVDRAITSGRPQQDIVRTTLGRGHGGAAKMVTDYAYHTITSGNTGLHNSPRRAAKKAALTKVKTFRTIYAPGWRSLGARSGASEWVSRVRQSERARHVAAGEQAAPRTATGDPGTTSEFGVPPPFLVDTGRLVKALAPRWRLGTAATAYVREGPT